MSDTLSKNKNLVLSGAVLSSITLLAVKYYDRPIFYEHPKGIPYSKGLPIIGSFYKIMSNIDILHDMLLSEFEKNDTLTMSMAFIGGNPMINTIDPRNIEYILRTNFKNYVKTQLVNYALHDLFGNGIFNANGENWKYQRKAASFIFNVKNFRDEFTNVFVSEMKKLDEHVISKAARTQTPVDFHEMIYKYTLDSFVYIGFGVDINGIMCEEPVPFSVSFDILQRKVFQKVNNKLTPVTDKLKAIFTPWVKPDSYHIKVVDDFALSIIQQRRKEIENNVTGQQDLLAQFMNASNHHGEKLNDQELRDSILNFIIAGRDTTAQALSWLIYNLMLHPRVEKKMLEEINEHITDEIEEDSPAFYEAVRKMIYVHAALYESLRLHPPVPANQKSAIEDDILPDGTVIKAGQYIGWYTYSQGRCRKIWGENAADFQPERWLDENGKLKQESEGKWNVFNAGPRVCLGQKLATLESIVAISMLLRRYSFTMVPNQNITYDTSVTSPMKYGMKVFVEKR
ncbi:cytochrome P450 [Pilobolus umbonatus]|nr:cytochrome P450 [Pilobolus umbonatus]